ncbi:NADH-dependent FMN reductase, partial [Priestia megaterium]
VAPSYVYAHTTHFNQKNEVADPEVLGRIKNLANEVVYMQKKLKVSELEILN